MLSKFLNVAAAPFATTENHAAATKRLKIEPAAFVIQRLGANSLILSSKKVTTHP